MKGTQMGVILCQINSHPLASDFLHFATTRGAEPLNNQLIVRYCLKATGDWKLIIYISETFLPWSFEQIMILVTNKPYIPQVLQNKTIKNVQYFSPYRVLAPWILVFPPVWRGWSSTRNCFRIGNEQSHWGGLSAGKNLFIYCACSKFKHDFWASKHGCGEGRTQNYLHLARALDF